MLDALSSKVARKIKAGRYVSEAAVPFLQYNACAEVQRVEQAHQSNLSLRERLISLSAGAAQAHIPEPMDIMQTNDLLKAANGASPVCANSSSDEPPIEAPRHYYDLIPQSQHLAVGKAPWCCSSECLSKPGATPKQV